MFISLVRYTIFKSIVACSGEIKKVFLKNTITSTNLQNLTNYVYFRKSDVYNQQAPVYS